MCSSISAFSEESLKEIRFIGHMQDILFDLNVENLSETKEFLISNVFQSNNQDRIRQFVHCMFTAAEYHVLDVYLFCKALQDIIRFVNDQHILDILKRHLLSSFRTTAGIVGPRCFFLRQCMLHDILNSDEIVAKITSYYQSKTNNPERIINTFCWFAPEIEQHNPDLFNIILASIRQNMNTGMIYPPHKNFLLFYDHFRQNDWQLYKSITSYGFNPDMFSFILLRDDVNALQSCQYFDIEYRLQETIFDCSHILDTRPFLLHAAAFFGSVECFNFLLEKGARVEETANKRKTLVDFAVAGGNMKIMNLMKEKGMSLDNALETAIIFHRKEVVEWIMNNIHLHDHVIGSMLLNAVVSNDVNLVLKCIELGIDINYSNQYGKTALLIAAQYCHSDLVKFLLQHPQIDVNVGSSMNVLDWAISCDDSYSVKCILDCSKFNVFPEDKEDNSMMYAVSRGDIDVCRAFLVKGLIDLSYKDSENHTPLQYAVMYDCVDIVKLLIDQPGANINEADGDGRTLLHYAAGANFVDIMKILICHQGININLKDNNGATPLTLAISWEQEEAVTALKEAGAKESEFPRVLHTHVDCHENCKHCEQ